MAKPPPTLNPKQRSTVRTAGWVFGLGGMMILEWHASIVLIFGGVLMFAAGLCIDWADHNAGS